MKKNWENGHFSYGHIRATGDLGKGIGSEVTLDFDSLHPLGAIFDAGQADFSIRTKKFSQQNRFASIVTLRGHPLSGWRMWRVMEPAPGEVVVQTAAVDHPTGWYNYMQDALGATTNGVMPLWQDVLLDVERNFASSYRRDPGSSYNNVAGTINPSAANAFLPLMYPY